MHYDLQLKFVYCSVFQALDAAAPLFENEHIDVRLDRTDASFVDAIHTDSRTFVVRGYGIKEAFGHIDFYPNGGYEQKDCRKNDGLYYVSICTLTLSFKLMNVLIILPCMHRQAEDGCRQLWYHVMIIGLHCWFIQNIFLAQNSTASI